MILTKDSYFKFSGGEVHCKVHQGISTIRMCDYTMDGFMALAEVVAVTRYRHGKNHDLKVIYPYLPYARQDRVMQTDEPFSLKIFCDMLNALNLREVIIYDPHSDVAPALINNCYIVPQHKIARKVIPIELLEDHNVMIVSPDAGAYKKTCKIMTDDRRVVVGQKVRNSKGEIVQTKIFSPIELTGKPCIIVDDICDGGRTFIELAKALEAAGASQVHLYVTHGIFSKGLEPLLQAGISKFYTTDSFVNVSGPAVNTYKIPETFHDCD